MRVILLTALAIGGSTIIGSLLGFLFKKIPHKWNDAILGFAAGIMLAASIFGLIIPSVEITTAGQKGKGGIFITIAGILIGAIFLNLTDKLTPHLHQLTGVESDSSNKVMLFVLAIAIHNFPEGLAAGVGFASDDITNAIVVAAGIALQNIPEGMVIISPLLMSGVSKKRTFFIALATGLIEVIGTLIGYLAASISFAILPFALAFAGGTMLYVISDEMIPETHSHGYERLATYSIIIGFVLMLLTDTLLS